MVPRGCLVKTYIVAWRFHSRQYSIDIDDENRAMALCVALNELNENAHPADRRSEVALTGVEFEIDAELQARIWGNIQRRINSDGAEKLAVFA